MLDSLVASLLCAGQHGIMLCLRATVHLLFALQPCALSK